MVKKEISNILIISAPNSYLIGEPSICCRRAAQRKDGGESFAPCHGLAALSLSVAEVGCEALSFDSRVHPDTMRRSKFVWAFDGSV